MSRAVTPLPQAADGGRRVNGCRRHVTPLYRAIMVEVERRRMELGWPAWVLDDKSGVQDGYSQKMVWADAPSGRRSSWGMVQLLIDALFPGGFDVEIKPRNGSHYTPLQHKSKINHSAAFYKGGRALRAHMRALQKRVGAKGWPVTPKSRRSAIARHAAKVRWERYRGQFDTTVD